MLMDFIHKTSQGMIQSNILLFFFLCGFAGKMTEAWAWVYLAVSNCMVGNVLDFSLFRDGWILGKMC